MRNEYAMDAHDAQSVTDADPQAAGALCVCRLSAARMLACLPAVCSPLAIGMHACLQANHAGPRPALMHHRGRNTPHINQATRTSARACWPLARPWLALGPCGGNGDLTGNVRHHGMASNNLQSVWWVWLLLVWLLLRLLWPLLVWYVAGIYV